MLRALLRRWYRGPVAPDPPTRMTAAEVLAVARAAGADWSSLARALTHAVPRRSGDEVIWHVGSLSKDASLEVQVSDATGAVIVRRVHHRPYGLR